MRTPRCSAASRRRTPASRSTDLDKIVFASDCPFDPEKGTMYIRETLRIIEGIDMPKADKEKIWHGNLEAITGVKFKS